MRGEGAFQTGMNPGLSWASFSQSLMSWWDAAWASDWFFQQHKAGSCQCQFLKRTTIVLNQLSRPIVFLPDFSCHALGPQLCHIHRTRAYTKDIAWSCVCCISTKAFRKCILQLSPMLYHVREWERQCNLISFLQRWESCWWDSSRCWDLARTVRFWMGEARPFWNYRYHELLCSMPSTTQEESRFCVYSIGSVPSFLHSARSLQQSGPPCETQQRDMNDRPITAMP